MGGGLLHHMFDMFDVRSDMLKSVLDVLGNIAKVSADCRVIILEIIGLVPLFSVLCEKIECHPVFCSCQELIYNLGFSFRGPNLECFFTEFGKVVKAFAFILPQCGLLVSVLINNSDKPEFRSMALKADFHAHLMALLAVEGLPEWMIASVLTLFGVIFEEDPGFVVDPLIFRQYLESKSLSIRASSAMTIGNICESCPFFIPVFLASGIVAVLLKMISEGQFCETLEAVTCLASLISFSDVPFEISEQEVVCIFLDFIQTSGSELLYIVLMAVERILKDIALRNGSIAYRDFLGSTGWEAIEEISATGCERDRIIAARLITLLNESEVVAGT
jgi:hypothetical protein